MDISMLKEVVAESKPKDVDNYVKDILDKSQENQGLNPSKMDEDLPNAYSFLPSGGNWEGKKGDSTWRPNPETVPDPENKKGGNPEGKSWKELQEKHNIDGVEFKEGDPNFNPVSKEDVEIDNFTEDRTTNFQQADEKCAEKWNQEAKEGKTDWTPRDISNFRKTEGYTWHECRDCKTLQLVPREIHNNVPHAGGISEIKQQNRMQA